MHFLCSKQDWLGMWKLKSAKSFRQYRGTAESYQDENIKKSILFIVIKVCIHGWNLKKQQNVKHIWLQTSVARKATLYSDIVYHFTIIYYKLWQHNELLAFLYKTGWYKPAMQA